MITYRAASEVPAETNLLIAPTGASWVPDSLEIGDPPVWHCKDDSGLTRSLRDLFTDYGHLSAAAR
jgi:hypothetical protein